MQNFVLGRDDRGNIDYSIPFSDDSWAVELAPASSVTVPVPKGSKKAVFSCTGDDYFVGTTGPITLPTATVASINGEMAPANRDVSRINGEGGNPQGNLYVACKTAETFNVTFYS